MITDLVIGIGHSLFQLLVGLAPEMPARPEWMDGVLVFFGAANYVLPMQEVLTVFMPWLLGVWAGLAVWRAVRLLLPGG